MSRNLTARFLRETETAINNAVSISDVTRYARYACGYRIARLPVEYSADDVAWFRSSLGGK